MSTYRWLPVLFISSFPMAHVSLSTTLQNPYKCFYHLVFTFLSSSPLRSSLLFENASDFPITILLLISMWYLASVAIILPIWQNSFTCSTHRCKKNVFYIFIIHKKFVFNSFYFLNVI